jgi:hypothetical protein
LLNLAKTTEFRINKYTFFCCITITVLLTATTSALLYNNPNVVEPQKQKTSDYYNRSIENQNSNPNEKLIAPNTSPDAGWDTPLTPWDELDIITTTPATTTPDSTPSPPVFNVTTTNYECTTGDPSTAIQNAIDSLPENRTEPTNITLQGVFNSVRNVLLEDNINFVGQNAVLIAVNNTNMFTLNPNKNTFGEIHKVFNIDGYDRQFVDWINLHNVTFQSIDFQHPLEAASGDYAINCFQFNSTGWGVNDNFNIYNCKFNGFYSGFYGLPINSHFENNVFSNFTSNGFMLPYGFNVTIKNNIFNTLATNPEVLSYPGNYPIIGLHLLDINISCIVCNNTFITNDYSFGLAVVSSMGNITVTNNIFIGNGQPIAVDFYPRPFNTEGLYVYDNIGQSDFSIP